MKKGKYKKVLVLGSGALKIGEAGEFDYSGSQAIKALKSEGLETVLVNPNIATIQTSQELADKIYLVPVEPHFVEKVIMRERPDGILLSMGGQTALNCGVILGDIGVLERFKVSVMGTSITSIKKTEDRELFKKELLKLGLFTPNSQAVTTVAGALQAGQKIGFPVIIRVAYALGGLGSTIAYNSRQLEEMAKRAFAGSRQILVEEYLAGWKEIEYEVVRDEQDNCITVCNMENFDPMGIHTGESIVVAPSQTLTNEEYQLLRSIAIQVIRKLKIVGECNIQFALHPKKLDYRIIEVNARLSRSSALASKATGYPLAYVATKLALGKRLDELGNAVTGVTKAFFEPSLDYIVVKVPRWDLEKFQNASKSIGSEMKSVGEVMAIGRTFEEAIQKAMRMLDQGFDGVIEPSLLSLTKAQILKKLHEPSPDRIRLLTAALYFGVSIEELYKQTNIDAWFLQRLGSIVQTYRALKKATISADWLRQAKKTGFSDEQLADIWKMSTDELRKTRQQFGVIPRVKRIDTLAGEFPAQTNYLYLTYHGETDDLRLEAAEKEKIIILGSGAYRIGSSVEFDWCAVNTALAVRKRAFQTVMINCNPETVSTDYDYSDSLYFEELTEERILDIYEKEGHSVFILSVGGQIPNNLAKFFAEKKIPHLGSQAASILQAEDRHVFSELLEKNNISQPPWAELRTADDVTAFAHDVGYPILIRPSFVLSGEAMSVLYSDTDVKEYLQRGKERLRGKLVVSKFIEEASEIDYDAVAVGGEVVVKAISEHVERAGVHSGDSTLVLPPYRLGNDIIAEVNRVAAKIARALSITGPFNIQFLERNGHLMVIECNLRCSRSFPFVSKVTGINFMDVAVGAMLGEEIRPIAIGALPYVGVKAAQFSFNRIKGADPVLRVEMTSTGEVGTLGSDLYDAFLKSLLATGQKLPQKNIFLSIGGWENKEMFSPYAKMLVEMGFSLLATNKTAHFLKGREIPCLRVAKLYEGGSPNAVELLQKKQIDFVINITEPPTRGEEKEKFSKRVSDGYHIRRTAIDFHVPLITNLELAMLFVRALREKRYTDLEVLPTDAYSTAQYDSEHRGGQMIKPIHGVWKSKHVVSVDQFTKGDLDRLLSLSATMKSDIRQGKIHQELAGKIMAAIFYESSSRTFGSFITAMQRLGGGIIPLQGITYSSVSKGELLPDTIRTFANYADVIVLRHPEVGSASVAAEYSPVPVINAGDGIGEHPTQALLDLFTITEHFKTIEGLTIAMVGDLLNGRTIHSLAKLLAHYQKITVYFVSPEILYIRPEFANYLKKLGLSIVKMDNLSEVIPKVDVLYMTRVQKERFADLAQYEKVKNYYVLTPQLMKKAKKDMIVMHPFPRVGEISYDVDSDPRAVYIRNQMQNGLYVRMALLLLILGKA